MNYVSSETKPRAVTDTIVWILITLIGATIVWAALLHLEIKGIVTFFVFLIWLNTVDVVIDFFRGINNKNKMEMTYNG